MPSMQPVTHDDYRAAHTGYAFCETILAGSLSPWHIRKLTERGLKPGGGADSPALCGRKVAWDIATPIRESLLKNACKKCQEVYREH